MLIYGLEEPEADKTQAILERHGIAAYVFGDDVLDQTVDMVFDAEEDFDGRHQEFPSSYMLFDGFELNEVTDILSLLQKNGAEFNGVKVMRNDNNVKWTMRDVLIRTAASFEASKQALELSELIRSCNGLDLSSADGKIRIELRKNLSEAVKLLRSGTYTAEQVETAKDNLSNSMKGARKLYS